MTPLSSKFLLAQVKVDNGKNYILYGSFSVKFIVNLSCLCRLYASRISMLSSVPNAACYRLNRTH